MRGNVIHQLTQPQISLSLSLSSALGLFLHRARQKLLKISAHSRGEISRHGPVFNNFTDTVMNPSLLC